MPAKRNGESGVAAATVGTTNTYE